MAHYITRFLVTKPGETDEPVDPAKFVDHSVEADSPLEAYTKSLAELRAHDSEDPTTRSPFVESSYLHISTIAAE